MFCRISFFLYHLKRWNSFVLFFPFSIQLLSSTYSFYSVNRVQILLTADNVLYKLAKYVDSTAFETTKAAPYPKNPNHLNHPKDDETHFLYNTDKFRRLYLCVSVCTSFFSSLCDHLHNQKHNAKRLQLFHHIAFYLLSVWPDV